MPIVLGSPTIEAGDTRLTYRVETKGIPGAHSLWFSVPVEAEPLLNHRGDAAVVALLMPLMAIGHEVSVEGPVTNQLAWNVNGEVQEILRRVQPQLAPIRVHVENPVPPLPPSTAVATGFSAGVDSYATLARFHFGTDVPHELRVTHLLYNNVGSHGHGPEGSALYKNRLNLLRPNARSTGLPLIDIDSNVDEFFLAVRLAFQQSHTMRNASVVHLLSAGIRQYLYASSVPYEDISCKASIDLGFADPLLLPFLSTRSVTLQPSGTEMDRAAKTALIAQIPHTYESLDVCVDSSDGTNCSACRKCRRTMLTLDLHGFLPRYSKVFSTPTDPRWREEHLVESLIQGTPSSRGVVRLYDELIGVPKRVRLEARRRVAVQQARRAFRFARRRTARLFKLR